MRRLVALICLIPLVAIGQEDPVTAPDPVTVPARAEKSYGEIVLVRTSYVHPVEEPGWGRVVARVARGSYLSAAEGYEVAPESPQNVVDLDIKETAIRSPVFRQAFRAYSESLRLLAVEDYYTRKIEAALEADAGADVSALTAKRSAIRTKLSISE